MQFRSNQ
nr:hypothetical chloroplast RF2 [Solanum mariae]YP_010345685.1 hypothetical chloroplast RF2 [Solanum reductum]YP_010346885.1 hypothetical chloroplast RF2 [Solanum caripense]YP_010347134.1 hypothetical chloroplast RF2 [Solanum cochoae]UNZ89434.1 hypothetical chloroplast RF2 [Solanum reductum]UNZ90717.1 hypothetical chloroplast RF2 [Solanum caripense]UNZ90966.1 hypothetical chloroplast RF2 [Solanum cochoae]UNZ93013.1 hypothetical chloroplast RF2 [Solanum mariae]